MMWHVELADEDAELGLHGLLQVLADLLGLLGDVGWPCWGLLLVLATMRRLVFVLFMDARIVLDPVEALSLRVSVG